MYFSMATVLNTNDPNVQKIFGMTTQLYQKLSGILIICAVVVTIVTIIFLMYTHNDKQVTSLKSALKKILITVVIFLTLGSVYTYLMGRAKNDDWDPNVPMSNSEPAPPDKDGNHTAY